MPKWTTPSDSAHRIGPSTLSKDVLTVDEGVSGWGFKNGRIGNAFISASRTSGRTAKRTPPFDSARGNRPCNCSREVLTVDEGVSGWGFENGRIGNAFASASRSKGRTGEMEGGVGFSGSNRCIYPLQGCSNCK